MLFVFGVGVKNASSRRRNRLESAWTTPRSGCWTKHYFSKLGKWDWHNFVFVSRKPCLQISPVWFDSLNLKSVIVPNRESGPGMISMRLGKTLSSRSPHLVPNWKSGPGTISIRLVKILSSKSPRLVPKLENWARHNFVFVWENLVFKIVLFSPVPSIFFLQLRWGNTAV